MKIHSLAFIPKPVPQAFLNEKEKPQQGIKQKIQKIALSALAGMAVGACIGIVFGGYGIVIGLGLGCAIGLATGLFLSRQKTISLPKNQLNILDEVGKKIASPGLINTIDHVKQVLARNTIQFAQCYEHHALHQEVTDITDAIKTKEDLKPIWKVFLNGLKGTPVHYPDGTTIYLDFSQELKRLNGVVQNLITETLDPKSPSLDQDIDQVYRLEEECFGEKNTFSRREYKALFSKKDTTTIVVRDQSTKTILGVLFYRVEESPEGPQLHICRVGRKAEAAKLKIGDKLFSHLFSKNLKAYRKIFLEVRKSNGPAIALYRKFGFEKVKCTPSYYSYPKEAAYIMTCDPAAHELAV